MTDLMIVENGYATLTQIDDFGAREITTTRLNEGQYVRIDDGKNYPQLCAGGGSRGWTLTYSTPEQLARDCGAKLYRTRKDYEAAKTRHVA